MSQVDFHLQLHSDFPKKSTSNLIPQFLRWRLEIKFVSLVLGIKTKLTIDQILIMHEASELKISYF